MKILVINSGSSSLKFQMFDMKDLRVLASGHVEQIGEDAGEIKMDYRAEDGKNHLLRQQARVRDHREAMEIIAMILREHDILSDVRELAGVGHRVVHGGEYFHEPTLITGEILEKIRCLIPLAPLHNPANITGVEVLMTKAPGVPQVAVFDTAFHQSIPEYAYLYALPEKLYQQYKVRRYGFHGTSHSYVSSSAAEHLGRPLAELKIISLHLGNGASAAAVDRGKCVDTSMGLTPLEGLVMGTRSGDIDPAIIFYLAREAGMDINEIDRLLNRESGLKGLCGNNDMRAIEKLAAGGDREALLAIEIFCYRIKKYIGAYLAVLGGVDCVIFTGGIGEHDAVVRAKCLAGLSALGISVDLEKNMEQHAGIMEIHTPASTVKILVVPTDEELEIARQTSVLISGRTTENR